MIDPSDYLAHGLLVDEKVHMSEILFLGFP